MQSSPSAPAPVTLGVDTDIRVLMQALLGTSDTIDALRDRQSADVESRLAEVLAAVGLTTSESAATRRDLPTIPSGLRHQRLRPSAASLPIALSTSAATHRLPLSPPSPGGDFRRWLWMVVPALLVVAFMVTWLTSGRGAANQPVPVTAGDPLLPGR